MTSNEIRVDAQLLTGFQINDVTAFIWVKDAARNILREHPLASPRKTVEVNIDSAGQTYKIEDELVRIEKVNVKGERRPTDQNYFECDELGNMMFFKRGTFEITYRYVPAMPNTVDDNLPLPNRYAEFIKYYVAARMRGRIYGQGDNDAQTFDTLFWQYIADTDIAMERTNKRHRRMPARF